MPGLTLERELFLLKEKISNLKTFISNYEKQDSEFIDQIYLRTLCQELFRLIMCRFDIEQRIDEI